MSTTEELPTKPSDLKFANPQAAAPRQGDMPTLTEIHCPECHKAGVVRVSKGEHRIGAHRVRHCRVGHLWSPTKFGGAKAVAALLKAREKRNRARNWQNPKTGKPIVPALAPTEVDDTNGGAPAAQ